MRFAPHKNSHKISRSKKTEERETPKNSEQEPKQSKKQ